MTERNNNNPNMQEEYHSISTSTSMTDSVGPPLSQTSSMSSEAGGGAGAVVAIGNSSSQPTTVASGNNAIASNALLDVSPSRPHSAMSQLHQQLPPASPVPTSSGTPAAGGETGMGTSLTLPSAPITPQNPFESLTPAVGVANASPPSPPSLSTRSAAGGIIPAVQTPTGDPSSPIRAPSSSRALFMATSGGPSTPLTSAVDHSQVQPSSLPRLPHYSAQHQAKTTRTTALSSSSSSPVPPPSISLLTSSSDTMRWDHQRQPVFDDDENTEPSSVAHSTMALQNNPAADDDEGGGGNGGRRGPNSSLNQGGSRNNSGNNNNANNSNGINAGLTRLMEYTRQKWQNTMQSRNRGESDGPMLDGVLICGYLQKLGRNGKWQTRWFETDGECLTYYKSSKRIKLLATLDLEKVGDIDVDDSDSSGCSFTIQVLGRLYHLQAESRAACKDWVITLNRIKEARLQQGNVKLVNSSLFSPLDLLDQHDVTPRVVVVANRQRTRAVDETLEWEKLMGRPSSNAQPPDVGNNNNPASYEGKRRTAIGTVVLARWSKRKTTLARLKAKFSKWASSIRRYGCMESESVQLDHHVHPPGHDDRPIRKQSTSEVQPSVSSSKRATDKATTSSVSPSTNPTSHVVNPVGKSKALADILPVDRDAANSKQEDVLHRKNSASSEDFNRVLS